LSRLRSLASAFTLAAGLLAPTMAAFGAAPPPVPALPDTQRQTSYSITASTCACAVGFQLFGDSTDVANWLEVFVNGVQQVGNWTISSPTGPLSTIPRPITDAVLTFAAVQTGTVQIVGARRPRRVSQFSENQGVSARNLNQALTDIVAQNRETWDKINDVTGRGVYARPGETLALLPVLASRANMGACFDSAGNLTSCVAASSGTFIAGAGIQFTGTNPTTISLIPNALAPNSQTGNYTIQNSDCGLTVVATNGPNTLTLPGAGSVPLGCEVAVKNGDTTRAKILSGFPADIIGSKLWPLQAAKVKSNGSAWLTTANPGRWKVPNNTTVFMDAINGNDTNDCLAAGAGNACQTFNQVLRINLHDYFDLTGLTNFSSGNLTGTANLNVQLADNETSAGACTTCYAGAHLAFSAVGFEGRAAIVIRGDVSNPQNTIIADSVLPAGIDVYGGGIFIELDSVQVGQSSCGSTPKNLAGVTSNDHAMVRLERNVVLGCANGAQLQAATQGYIAADNGFSIVGGGQFFATAADGGVVAITNQIVTCGGSPAYSAQTLAATRMGLINAQNVTWSGCGSVTGTRYSATELSLITTATGSPNTTIPGNANGSATTGSQVD
jgi:hypothetical protein